MGDFDSFPTLMHELVNHVSHEGQTYLIREAKAVIVKEGNEDGRRNLHHNLTTVKGQCHSLPKLLNSALNRFIFMSTVEAVVKAQQN